MNPPALNTEAPPRRPQTRQLYLDHLKLALTGLVVFHHAGQAYGPPEDWPIRSVTADLPLGALFEVNGAFFMGLFFLVSALFLPRAIDRNGVSRVLRDRLLRLGAPLLVVTLLIYGPASYLMRAPDKGFWRYFIFDYLGGMRFEVGHLWFLSLLLVMSGAYGLWRLVAPAAPSRPLAPPGHLSLLAAVAFLAAANAIVRLRFPVGVWVDVAPFVRVEMGRLPQYLMLFAVGLAAGRNGWLQAMPTSRGSVWLGIGLVAAAMRICQPANRAPNSLLWLVEEAAMGVGLSLGLLVFARDRLGQPIRAVTRWSADAYGVYVVHIFIVVAAQAALDVAPIGAGLKLSCVFVIGIAVSLILTEGLRLIPGVRRVL